MQEVTDTPSILVRYFLSKLIAHHQAYDFLLQYIHHTVMQIPKLPIENRQTAFPEIAVDLFHDDDAPGSQRLGQDIPGG